MRTSLSVLSPSTRRRTAVVAIGATLALSLAACGSDSTPATSSAPNSSAGAAAGVSTEHNDTDVAFINDMTPHHSGAIEMAKLAPAQAGSQAVKDLANRIAGAQGPEIEQMQAMAAAWKTSLSTDPAAMGGMGGMGSGDVPALTSLRGAAFDREFLTRMTAHHTSALEMAKTELAQGQNPQAKDLATAIIAAQEKEIAQMGQLLKSV